MFFHISLVKEIFIQIILVVASDTSNASDFGVIISILGEQT